MDEYFMMKHTALNFRISENLHNIHNSGLMNLFSKQLKQKHITKYQ